MNSICSEEIWWSRAPPSSRSKKKMLLSSSSSQTDMARQVQVLLPQELSTLHDHDCLLPILEFLQWEDLNVFSLSSKGCYQMRSHRSLDQTRSGSISLGKGVTNAKALMDKVRQQHWSDAFCGHRTHLRLSNLTYLSSDIDPIDDAFVDTISPLRQVTSLDCSMVPPPLPQHLVCGEDRDDDERLRRSSSRRPWFLAPFEDYVDKGFAQGLTLSLLVPNLRSIDMSYLPLTMVGVAWLTENNPNLEVIRWNHSLVWPISDDSENHLEALKYLKEVYLDEARMIFCADLNADSLWKSLLAHTRQLERVSLLGTLWYQGGELSELSQASLVKFVRGTPSLQWFRSDLTLQNVELLKRERPEVTFVSSW